MFDYDIYGNKFIFIWINGFGIILWIRKEN